MVSFLVGNQVCRGEGFAFSRVQLNDGWCGFYDTTGKQTKCRFYFWMGKIVPSFIPLFVAMFLFLDDRENK